LKALVFRRARTGAGPRSAGLAMNRRTSLGVLAGTMAAVPAIAAAPRDEDQEAPPSSPPVGTAGQPSDETIVHRRSATARITSVHGKLRNLVFAREDYGVEPGGDGRRNAAALQRAVDEAQVIHLPDSADVSGFAGTVALRPHTRLVGATDERTRLVSAAALAFSFEADDGAGGDLSGPQLEDFGLHCAGSAIRINRENGGFSDTSGQRAVMRPLLRRLRLSGAHDPRQGRSRPESIGVQWIKCFDGVIDQCEIRKFGTGYQSIGSDLIGIRGRTRIWACDTLVDAAIRGSFGGSLHLDGLDLLMARECYIRSEDRHLIVTNCYLEHYPGTPALEDFALQFGHHYTTLFKNNRLELPESSVPRFLNVDDRDGHLFVFEDNSTAGEPWGQTRWNAPGGARYWASQYDRNKIIHRGNAGAAPLPLPFCTVERVPDRNSRSGPWVFNPDNPGLEWGDFGLQLRVDDGAFILPAGPVGPGGRPACGVHFHPERGAIHGRVDIWVEARADTAGKTLELWHANGDRWQATARQALGGQYAWYRMFADIEVADLRLWAVNPDASGSGAIRLREIVVEMRAPPVGQ
jgi:hypothetical protein